VLAGSVSSDNDERSPGFGWRSATIPGQLAAGRRRQDRRCAVALGRSGYRCSPHWLGSASGKFADGLELFVEGRGFT